MTLALVTEMTSAQLCQLDLADIAPDADAVRVDGCWFTIPAYARSLVRAQVLARLSWLLGSRGMKLQVSGHEQVQPLYYPTQRRGA
jgi:hypothetical protein